MSKFPTIFLPVREDLPTLAAGAALVMNTNSVPLSSVSEPSVLSHTQQTRVHVLFQLALSRFVLALKRWFLPHLLGGIGVFLLVAYATANMLFSSWAIPFRWVGILCVLFIYGVVAFGYSFFTSCVFALRLACVEWNDFIDDILSLVQDRAASQLTDMNVGLSKPEATHLVRGSVRDVFSSVKQQQTGLPRGLVILCLGFLAAAVRAVLSAKILKWSGRTIQLGKLFAGRATLVGAIFLNLHFFATLLLGFCYIVGALVLIGNIYFVFFAK